MHRFGVCCLAAVQTAVGRYGYTAVGVRDWLALGEGALDLTHAVWHHDASAHGFSPGMADYIQGQVRKHKSGANIWVGLDGGWRFLAAGITYHAGPVLPGKPGNPRSAGIETDHTTGEDIGLHLLQSLRVGTAGLFNHWQRDVTALEFHKTICRPPGRKPDPDGLGLRTERAAVAQLMTTEDDMFEKPDRDKLNATHMLATQANNRAGAALDAVLKLTARLEQQPAGVDLDALADAVADRLAQRLAD